MEPALKKGQGLVGACSREAVGITVPAKGNMEPKSQERPDTDPAKMGP